MCCREQPPHSAIVGAARADTVRTRAQNVDDARAVAVDWRRRFACERKRREDLLAIMHGNAVALRAKALDGEGDGAGGHARLEAGSVAKRQPSRTARNSNHDMKMRGQYRSISGLRHEVRRDMVRAMLTAEEIQIRLAHQPRRGGARAVFDAGRDCLCV